MNIGIYSDMCSGIMSKAGGAEVQLRKTAQELSRLGHNVEFLKSAVNVEQLDVIHLFRITDEVVDFFESLPVSRPPVVISTVFWNGTIPVTSLECGAMHAAAQYWKRFARKLRGNKSSFKGYEKASAMLEKADLLLPNSKAEQVNLYDFFRIGTECHPVPNAVDPELVPCAPDPVPALPEKFILSVGRIDDRKNRLNLVRAVHLAGLPLIIVGATPKKRRYRVLLEKIRKTGGDMVQIIEPMDQPQLSYYYQRAAVHALPSWFETPGLASLEAALFDCPVVVTEGGCTREYFGEHAFYCRPDSVMDIAAAIKEAVKTGTSKELGEKIRSHYTWEAAAKETVTAYIKAGVVE